MMSAMPNSPSSQGPWPPNCLRPCAQISCTRPMSATRFGVAGEADVALRFGPGQWPGLQSRFIADERLLAVASPGYRGGNLPRSIDELRACALIRHPESAWRIWFDALGIDDTGFPTAAYVDDAGLALEAAAAGQGVALARTRLAADDLRAGRLARLFDHEVPAEYAYWCVWSPTARKQAAISGFVE